MNLNTTTNSVSGFIEQIVRTSDHVKIGEVEAVSKDIFVVKRGIINKHRYYIPINKVEKIVDNVLQLKITENDVK